MPLCLSSPLLALGASEVASNALQSIVANVSEGSMRDTLAHRTQSCASSPLSPIDALEVELQNVRLHDDRATKARKGESWHRMRWHKAQNAASRTMRRCGMRVVAYLR